MAKLGSAPPANRYDGIATGPTFAYLFETQTGIPVDGTDAQLRDLSPFVVSLVVPDELLEVASGVVNDVDLLQAAAQGSDSIATASQSILSVMGDPVSGTATLEAFVTTGQFFTDADATFVSSIADAFQAADIMLQVKRMLEAEPLTLLVNPTDMSIQYTKIQSFQSRTRQGFVFEAWGEDLPTVSFSGTTAGFVAGAVDVSNPYGAQQTGEATSVTGYQEAAKRDSAAWQNFMSLYHFYKNNGYIYDTINKSQAHLFIGSVSIDFDQWTYKGHIDSFSFRFEEGSPHKVGFDMEFRVDKMYDRSAATSTVLPYLSSSSSTSLSNGDASLSDGSDFAQTPIDILGGF